MADGMKLYIDSRDELRVIELDHVVYLQASGNYTDFHDAHGQVVSELSCLSAFEKQIAASYAESVSPFLRTGRSHLINTNYVSSINLQRETVRFSTGEMLHLSKQRLKLLKEYMIALHRSHH